VPATATVDAAADAVRVVLDERLRGVAPGQSVVLYEGTRVVGSATISGTGRA
jgi:tRNA-uridine 2-sulfurtransferase